MKEQLTCMIVDDEPLAVRLLESFVARTPFLRLLSSHISPEEALAALASSSQPDIIFLDINMPGLTGLELARLVKEPTLVVFTTAFRDYAFESYAVHAFDYLLKPIDFPRFLGAAQRALEHFNRQPEQQTVQNKEESQEYMFVKCDYRMVRVDFDDILYVKALKDYVSIRLFDKKCPVIALATMKSLEERLPSDRFCRVHKSYIVNMRKIDAVERQRISIAGELIPVSDAYREAFTALLG